MGLQNKSRQILNVMLLYALPISTHVNPMYLSNCLFFVCLIFGTHVTKTVPFKKISRMYNVEPYS